MSIKVDVDYFKKAMLNALNIPGLGSPSRREILMDAGVFVIEDENWWDRSNAWQSSSALARVNMRRQLLYIEKLKKAAGIL